jgi:hypothetical protein
MLEPKKHWGVGSGQACAQQEQGWQCVSRRWVQRVSLDCRWGFEVSTAVCGLCRL